MGMTKSKCYVIETDHPHVTYQKVLLICETRELAEMYLPIIKQKCEVDIPMRITERSILKGDFE